MFSTTFHDIDHLPELQRSPGEYESSFLLPQVMTAQSIEAGMHFPELEPNQHSQGTWHAQLFTLLLQSLKSGTPF